MKDEKPTVLDERAYKYTVKVHGCVPVCVRCKQPFKIGDLIEHRNSKANTKLYHQCCWLETFVDTEATEQPLTAPIGDEPHG